MRPAVFFTRYQPAGLPLAWGFNDRDFALQQAALLSAQGNHRVLRRVWAQRPESGFAATRSAVARHFDHCGGDPRRWSCERKAAITQSMGRIYNAP